MVTVAAKETVVVVTLVGGIGKSVAVAVYFNLSVTASVTISVTPTVCCGNGGDDGRCSDKVEVGGNSSSISSETSIGSGSGNR